VSTGTKKVGRVDDPIWEEPLPDPIEPRQRRRHTARNTVFAATVLMLLAVSVGWLAWPRHAGGDPGGQILDQLRPVSNAVPPSAKIEYAHYDEPAWDSCDGMAGTSGWDDPSVQVEFEWSSSPTTVIDFAKVALTHDGWGSFTPQVQNGLLGGAWTKRLKNGTTAQVQVGSDGGGSWFVFGQAPPVGQRVSGC
jgi:hypothetical protein